MGSLCAAGARVQRGNVAVSMVTNTIQRWRCTVVDVQRGERAPPPYAHHSTEGSFLKYFAAGDTAQKQPLPPAHGASYVRQQLPLTVSCVYALSFGWGRRRANCTQPDECFPFLFNKLSTLIGLGISIREPILGFPSVRIMEKGCETNNDQQLRSNGVCIQKIEDAILPI